MTRTISVFLAIGLAILWLAGLGQHATGWLTWLDGLAALCAFGIAVGAGPAVSRSFVSGAPLALAIGLGILWIAGLSAHAAVWQSWWTFAFACAFIALALSSTTQSTAAKGPRLA